MARTTAQEVQSAAKLARRLAELEQRLAQVERGSRLSNASMHGAPLLVYSPEDPETVRQIIGTQPDGSVTVVDTNAPPPPVPSLPTVEEHPGALVVTWDGTFVGGGPAPADWDHVEVHVSTSSGYEPTDATEIITIHSLKGGSVTLALDAVPQYVRLQAVNTSKVESAPTAEVEATPTPPVLTGGVKTYYEPEAPLGLDADDNGSLWFDTDNGNLPHRWDGVNLEWVAIPLGPAAVTSDGDEPTEAPEVELIGGFGALYLRWTAVVNADPVDYEVHVSKNANFVPDYAGGGTGPEFFETFTSDLSRWPAAYGGPFITGGQARLASSPGNYQGIATSQRFTMDQKAISAKITPQSVPGATQEVVFSMLADGQNSFQMLKHATNTAIVCRVRVNGVNSDLSVPVTTGQVWWRMRESGADINFEVSADQVTWTTLRTVAHGMATAALTSMQIDISCGDTNASSVLPALVTMVDDVAYGAETQSATLAIITKGTSHTIRTLPDGSRLMYENQPYYVKVVAKDPDGYGPWSAEDSDMLVQVNTPDISAEYAYLGTLLVNQLRGGTLTADIIMGAVMRSAESGQRAEVGPFGIVTYDSDNAPVIVMPSNADTVASIRAEIDAFGLTVNGKASFRGSAELAPGVGLTLQSSVTAPQSPPSVVVDWPQVQIPLFAEGTGQNPGNNRGLHWIDNAWQIFTGGTGQFTLRKFNPDGSFAETLASDFTGVAVPNPTRYHTGFKVGTVHWRIEHGTADNRTYIVRVPDVGAKVSVFYNRINTTQLPGLGWDGTNLLIAEYDSTNKRFRIQTMNPTTLAVASTVYTSVQNGFIGPVTGIIRGNFDLGSPRWAVLADNGVHVWLYEATGTYLGVETFPVKTVGSRGVAWDGTQFWTLTAGGSLTKHAPAQWNDAGEPQTWYTAMNWRDTDPGGTGVHETDMGPVATFQMRRRGWLTLSASSLPSGVGIDDPDAVGFFVGKVNASRVNLWRQTDPAPGVRSVTYSAFSFASSNPPAANNFPPGIPAWIRASSLDSFGLPALEFKGDGTGRFGGLSIEQFIYVHRARSQLNGGGLRRGDATGISWDARLMSTANGYSPDTASVGYFDISMPPNGTLIPGVGGAANQTVAGGVIPLPAWHALYYVLPLGSSFATVAGNFRIATYTSALTIPPHWVLVCFRSGEFRSPTYLWGDGEQTDIWKNLALSGTWLAYNANWTPGYKKENGLVFLRGLAKNASTTAPSTIATLPAGYRPGQQWVDVGKSGGATGSTLGTSTSIASRINVYDNTGVIESADNGPNSGVFISLFGVFFPAEN